MQQVFVVASRRLSSIAIGSERSFLLGTALRVARTSRRTLGRRREVPEEEGLEPLCLDPQPDELADQKRLRALLDEVLAAMPEELREVFVLFELEEMSTPEIATLLEIPTGTAASRLRRAREEFDRRGRERRDLGQLGGRRRRKRRWPEQRTERQGRRLWLSRRRERGAARVGANQPWIDARNGDRVEAPAAIAGGHGLGCAHGDVIRSCRAASGRERRRAARGSRVAAQASRERIAYPICLRIFFVNVCVH